jgi:hypothetical protein
MRSCCTILEINPTSPTMHALRETCLATVLVSVAAIAPVCLAWGLIVLAGHVSHGGLLVLLAQIAAGFIAIFGIPLTLYGFGRLLQTIKIR